MTETAFSLKSFDGTIIRGKTRGEGPALVLVNGLSTVDSYWKYVAAHFSRRFKVVLYDLRGHGASDLPHDPNESAIRSHARDLAAIIDQLELSPAVIAGFSMGVQVDLEHYALSPQHVRAMMLVTGPYQTAVSNVYGLNLPNCLLDPVLLAAKISAPLYAPLWRWLFKQPFAYNMGWLIGAIRGSRDDMQPFFDHLAIMPPSWFFRFALGANHHSAAAILGSIKIPVLIIGGGRDHFTPAYLSEEMARSIPGAELFLLKEGTHTTLIQAPERVIARMSSFLQERVGISAP